MPEIVVDSIAHDAFDLGSRVCILRLISRDLRMGTGISRNLPCAWPGAAEPSGIR